MLQSSSAFLSTTLPRSRIITPSSLVFLPVRLFKHSRSSNSTNNTPSTNNSNNSSTNNPNNHNILTQQQNQQNNNNYNNNNRLSHQNNRRRGGNHASSSSSLSPFSNVFPWGDLDRAFDFFSNPFDTFRSHRHRDNRALSPFDWMMSPRGLDEFFSPSSSSPVHQHPFFRSSHENNNQQQHQLQHQQHQHSNNNTQPFMSDSLRETLSLGRQVPPMDVAETENEYHISLDVPGVKKDELKITITDQPHEGVKVLTVSGERRHFMETSSAAQQEQSEQQQQEQSEQQQQEAKQQEDKQQEAKQQESKQQQAQQQHRGRKSSPSPVRREQAYSRFSRSISLPENADVDAISAKCEDGVLMITMPKRAKEEKKHNVRHVQIQ